MKLRSCIEVSKKVLFVVSIALIGFGCGTTKQFKIESVPGQALVMVHESEQLEDSNYVVYGEETPTRQSINFWGEQNEYYVTAEKRGYEPKTRLVTKESQPFVSFNLEKIPGISAQVFRKDNLHTGKFTLLPPSMEVIIHSGVGRLDKKTLSPELSDEVSTKLQVELSGALQQNRQFVIPDYSQQSLLEDWSSFSDGFKDNIIKFNVKRLNYYSRPPYIGSQVSGFKEFIDNLKKCTGNDIKYLLYIWGKCISETKGRKTGNIILSILGAAVQGINPSVFYDPSAFTPDSGTLVVLYVIDAGTSEVLYIEPRYFDRDISKVKGLNEVVKVLCRFPGIDQKVK